jgi:hypothetical protein
MNEQEQIEKLQSETTRLKALLKQAFVAGGEWNHFGHFVENEFDTPADYGYDEDPPVPFDEWAKQNGVEL